MRDQPLPPRFAHSLRRRGLVYSLGLAYALRALDDPLPVKPEECWDCAVLRAHGFHGCRAHVTPEQKAEDEHRLTPAAEFVRVTDRLLGKDGK